MKFVNIIIYDTIKNQMLRYKSLETLPWNLQNVAEMKDLKMEGYTRIYHIHGLKDSLLRYLFCTNVGVYRVYTFLDSIGYRVYIVHAIQILEFTKKSRHCF